MISLRSGWGSGKSVFLRFMNTYLESRALQVPTISIYA
ncbi:hypothetical protein [Xanthomonas arboricola]